MDEIVAPATLMDERVGDVGDAPAPAAAALFISVHFLFLPPPSFYSSPLRLILIHVPRLPFRIFASHQRAI